MHEVTEMCPHCDNEITLMWNLDNGLKAYCPVCGNRLMLCSLCETHGFDCDYNTIQDRCKFNRRFNFV